MTTPKKCVAKESFQRMNYLYQVAQSLAPVSEPCNVASTMYSNLLIAISKKTVQRLDIDLKRTICKGCRCILQAGLTCTVKIRKKQAKWTCLQCRTTKVFNLKTDYKPWSQTEEGIVEILDYGSPQPK